MIPPLKEKPLEGNNWTRPWYLFFDGLNRYVTGLINALKFTDLTDVPSSYTGQAGKVVKVNVGETGLEFGSSNHNGLTGIQGGTTNEYYHLTIADHTEATSFLNGGTSTHTDLDNERTASSSHRANSLIHYEQEDIDHTLIDNVGVYDHDYLDIKADEFDVHVVDTSNPHSVTANQVLPSQATHSGKYLTTNGTNSSWATVTAGVSGSGTTNTIPLWTAGTTLGDSALSQSAGNVTCSGDFAIASAKVYKIDTTTVIDISGTRNYYGGGAIAGGGSDNVMIGLNSGKTGGSWSYNVGLGYRVFEDITSGAENVGIGAFALYNVTTGSGNVGVATSAMNQLTTGSYNTCLGTGALQSVTTGSYNFGLGNDSLYSVTSGGGNVGIGRRAGRFVTGSNNVCIAEQSGYGIGFVNGNISIGYQSMYQCSGNYNIAIGDSSGPGGAASTPSSCTYIGVTSGYRNTSGSRNVFIGDEAAFGASSYACSDTVVLGSRTMATTNPASNRVYIDTRSSVGASTLIYGECDNEILKVFGRFAGAKQTTTLGVGVTTFAVTRNHVVLTGDAGTNTIATITGGVECMDLTIKFVDALITITDDATATANTINLSAAFVSTANAILTLWFDGTKWFEKARSVN